PVSARIGRESQGIARLVAEDTARAVALGHADVLQSTGPRGRFGRGSRARESETGVARAMKAVILAGGKGTRLAPYTTVFPKPLMPVGDMPILEIMIRQLRHRGITELILCVGYLGALLEAYFGNGEKLGVNISYSYESEPLGTAGPIGLIGGLDETFFVMNGDLLTTIDFSAMLRFHRDHGRIATIGLADKH